MFRMDLMHAAERAAHLVSQMFQACFSANALVGLVKTPSVHKAVHASAHGAALASALIEMMTHKFAGNADDRRRGVVRPAAAGQGVA